MLFRSLRNQSECGHDEQQRIGGHVQQCQQRVVRFRWHEPYGFRQFGRSVGKPVFLRQHADHEQLRCGYVVGYVGCVHQCDAAAVFIGRGAAVRWVHDEHQRAVDLPQGQLRKIDRAIDEMQPHRFGPDSQILEIGCGWGAVAEMGASALGASMTGVTLSHEQLAWAKDRLAQAGLDADLRLQDYRDIDDEPFDAIVSIEMLEAVGDRKSTRLNSSHIPLSRMPSSA